MKLSCVIFVILPFALGASVDKRFLMSACVDDTTCLGLLHTFHLNGQDICTLDSFKMYCQRTCGLCPEFITSTPKSVCSIRPCVHGTCNELPTGAFQCTCNSGYHGFLCDKACMDDPKCPILVQSLQQNGQNVCTEDSLKVFCNQTCGLCLVLTTTKPTTPTTPLVISTISLPHTNAENRVCMRCYNLPHPWDCDKVVLCPAGDSCYVEQVVTNEGQILYNSGCASQQKCQQYWGRKRAVRYSRNMQEQLKNLSNIQTRAEMSRFETSVDEMHVNEYMEDSIQTCFECCNSSNYCNRNMCDPIDIPTNQIMCLNCPIVEFPAQCESLKFCNLNEICYTEFMYFNGEERYRMGCISQDACSKSPPSTIEPSLIGKRRFLMQNIDMTKYCSKCCSDRVGNCNRELCPKTGSVPPGINVSELSNPPERKDLCTDVLPDVCKLFVTQYPENCRKLQYANFACRETCGTCVNSGHVAGWTNAPLGTTTASLSEIPPTDCFYDSKKYVGAVSTTVSGKTCLSWADLDPNMQGMPDGSSKLAGSYCRDPDGRGFPWCFTSSSFDWEFCPVKYCQECFYPGQSVSYQGYVSVDSDNNTCSPWVDHLTSSKGTLTNNSFPDNTSADAKNYCRDPYKTGHPQCYVGGTLKNCSVPQCTTDCMDNPETKCAIIQQYVCKIEYTQATLCPKTCSMCKFGLLPPVYKQPPPDLCIDNPDANCPVLKSIICDDPIGALQLCPKTCKKCNLLYNTQSHVGSTTQKMTTLSTTTHAPTTTHTQTTTPVPTTKPHWLPWGHWQCRSNDGVCYRVRYRNCSTEVPKPCEDLDSGTKGYNFDLCSPSTCPDYYITTISTTGALTTSTKATTTTQQEACHDDASSIGCQDQDNLVQICQEKSVAWNFCAKSCNLCDTCWDYLDTCNTTGGIALFCGREDFAIQYCRRTCNKCAHKPVAVAVNSCGDPVATDDACDMLQKAICVCKDPDINVACKNYCAGKCHNYPTIDNNCTPAKRRKRDEILQALLFK